MGRLAFVAFCAFLFLAPVDATQVSALPERARLYDNATYVVTVREQRQTVVAVDARLSNVSVTTIPETACSVQEGRPLVVICDVLEAPVAVSIRGRLELGTPEEVVVTANSARDYQFVSGSHFRYLPQVFR